MDAEGMNALQAQLQRLHAETRETENALLQKVNEATAAPAPPRPARQIGGTKWVFLPWFTLLFAALSVTGLYVWAYFNGHLFDDGSIPFISTAIDDPPESCMGSFILAILAWMVFMMVAIRWRLNTSALDENNLANLTSSRRFHVLNGITFLAGLNAVLCLVGIGSFQEHNVRLAHLLCGAGFFCFMGFSMVGNVVIDFKLAKRVALSMRVFRLILALATVGVFVAIAVMYWVESNAVARDAKAVLEIVCSFLVMIYLMTYAYDFSGVELLFDVRKLSRHEFEHRQLLESEGMPLLTQIDGDVF